MRYLILTKTGHHTANAQIIGELEFDQLKRDGFNGLAKMAEANNASVYLIEYKKSIVSVEKTFQIETRLED